VVTADQSIRLEARRVPYQRRFEKTHEKIRHGGLSAPTHDPRQIGVGDGSVCDGCGETIEPRDHLISVNVRGVLALRFHDKCYAAWSTFKR
jgi:hypothetical protein